MHIFIRHTLIITLLHNYKKKLKWFLSYEMVTKKYNENDVAWTNWVRYMLNLLTEIYQFSRGTDVLLFSWTGKPQWFSAIFLQLPRRIWVYLVCSYILSISIYRFIAINWIKRTMTQNTREYVNLDTLGYYPPFYFVCTVMQVNHNAEQVNGIMHKLSYFS